MSIQVCSVSLEICFEILCWVLTITGGSPITLLGPKQCQLIAHVDHFCCCFSPCLLSLLWLALPAEGSPLDLDNWLHLCCSDSLWPQRLIHELFSWQLWATAVWSIYIMLTILEEHLARASPAVYWMLSKAVNNIQEGKTRNAMNVNHKCKIIIHYLHRSNRKSIVGLKLKQFDGLFKANWLRKYLTSAYYYWHAMKSISFIN